MSIEKKIKKNFDLTPLTTFRIGGRVEFFLEAKNKRELVEAINWAKGRKLSLSFLAGGSNVLITRKKIKGLVIKISGRAGDRDYKIKGDCLEAWAGVTLTKLAKIAADRGLAGLEWAYGVPGSLGGAVRGNAGAYGSDVSGQVIEVEAYDAAKGAFVKLAKQACGFSYRHSIFKQKNNLIILSVKLKLAKGASSKIKNLAKQNFNKRMAANPQEPSAGCIFKNLEYQKLIKQNPELAQRLEAKSLFRGGKIGAAYLIDQLGLKGETRGGAKVSERHANFIVNTGGATAKDAVNLINLIKKKIKKRYNVNLEEEVQYF